MDSIPITNTGIPSNKTQPTKKPTKSKSKDVPIWWLIVSLLIIFILSAGLIVAIFFNFNQPIEKTKNCPNCCTEIPNSNNYLVCETENQQSCRVAQSSDSLGSKFNMENVQLINGPFILISLNQSVNASFPAPSSSNPTSTLSTLNSMYVLEPEATPALSLSKFALTNQDNYFNNSTIHIDVFGTQTIVKESTQNQYLAISTNFYTVNSISLYGLKFVEKNANGNPPTGFVIPKAFFINNQLELRTSGSTINSVSNFRLIAINSTDSTYNSIFTKISNEIGVVMCTPNDIPQVESGLNNKYTLTQWTPYYLFQQTF
jgi:hypothetical protein